MKNTTRYISGIPLLALPRWTSAASWIGIEDSKLRSGDIDFATIPLIISNVTTYLLGFVATISMIMIMYGAVRMGL